MDSASFEALTPTAFLERAAMVWGDRVAVIDGEKRLTYAQFREESQRLAGALVAQGLEPGDRVAVLAPNTALMLTAHNAVPYAGGVLVALNHRLADHELQDILDHSGAKILLVDELFASRSAAFASPGCDVRILVGGGSGGLDSMTAEAQPLHRPVGHETGLLALNYTSGTTGRPKGVMYHHRGAYLQALAMAFHTGLTSRSVMLWTLPMFHCNGWCFTWAVSAAGTTNLCLPDVDPAKIWEHIRNDGVTHFNAAPTVLTMLADHPGSEAGPAPQQVQVATGGAPPSPSLLARLQELNFEVTHLYGLTETFGPSVICAWQPAWDDEPETSRLVARQGVGNVISQQVRVLDDRGRDVPQDGTSIGEVALRGNNVMLGYYRDAAATDEAIRDGWFHTGDLGVMHPDGYLELRDRAKDIIISGGENIASVEIEQALEAHPAVLECAVIATPDRKWGEVPAAYVTLKRGASVTAEELIEHVRNSISRFKAPKLVEFREALPKTATGKIQKHVLRDIHRFPDGET